MGAFERVRESLELALRERGVRSLVGVLHRLVDTGPDPLGQVLEEVPPLSDLAALHGRLTSEDLDSGHAQALRAVDHVEDPAIGRAAPFHQIREHRACDVRGRVPASTEASVAGRSAKCPAAEPRMRCWADCRAACWRSVLKWALVEAKQAVRDLLDKLPDYSPSRT